MPKEEMTSLIYTFEAPSAPWGIIQVTRPLTREINGEFDMITWPERYMQQAPECTKLLDTIVARHVDGDDTITDMAGQ